MSAASKRTSRACVECSGRKGTTRHTAAAFSSTRHAHACDDPTVRCEKDKGESRCVECIKQRLACTPRTQPPHRPCDACRRKHLGCDWPGYGPCTHCARKPIPCSFDSAGSASPEAPSSPSASDGQPSPPPAQRTPWLDVVLHKTP
ncbi:hypothetical protein BV20DRAFT_384527 [Pilatotrama ljubarskyi]|nr:hypothetical protein BV20DRAFT_384527 [Pilatotrama ljubarskyi]